MIIRGFGFLKFVSVRSVNRCIVIAPTLIVSALVSVRHVKKWDEDGHKIVDIYQLNHAPIEKEADYEISSEPVGVYKKEIGYEPDREWEDELPEYMRDPEPVQANISPEKVRLCQQVHDLQVEVLAGFGIDACRHYQQNKVEHVLEAVQHDDVQCPLCHKGLASGAAIRSHIRSKHMDVTPFVCSKCEKTFGDNQQLRGHMKTHVDKDKFPCTHAGCTRGFPTLGRLNSHLKTHDPSQHVSCKYCGNVFNAKRNLAPHEKTCKQQPGGKKAAVKDKACLFCPKTFYHGKDLKYHVDTAHKSRAGK